MFWVAIEVFVFGVVYCTFIAICFKAYSVWYDDYKFTKERLRAEKLADRENRDA